MKQQLKERKYKQLGLIDASSHFLKPRKFTTSEGLRKFIAKCTPKGKQQVTTGSLIRSAQTTDPSVTVIIPSFNTSLYIEQCIKSVCDQSLENIEIIIIDDASTDDTVQKILPFTYTDKRITLITLAQQSGSPGKARNIGMALASASYISFIDSDDWIDSNMLEALYSAASIQNSDICFLSGFINHLDDKSSKRYYKKPHIDSSSDLKGFHESFMLWDKLWRREFLLENELEIAHTSASEELLFIIKSYYLAQNVSVSTGNYGYNYRRLNPSSITKNIRSNLYPSFEFEAWGLVDNWLKENTVSDQYKNIICLRKLLSFNYALSIVNDTHRVQFSEEVGVYLTNTLSQSVLDIAHKLEYTSQIESLQNSINGFNVISGDLSTDEKSGNILFGPDWSSSNPYQKLLYKSLRNTYKIYATGFSPRQLTKEYLNVKRATSSILHLHWLHPFYDASSIESAENLIGIIRHAKRLGYTIVWTAHNIMPHEMDTTTESNHLLVREAVIDACDVIIVHDQRAQEALSKKFSNAADKISIAPHGLYEKTQYKTPSLKKSIKSELGIENERFTVLLAGRIRGYKGIERAIDIFTNGSLKLSETCTLIIAGYPDDENIDNQIKIAVSDFEHIKYVRGSISDADLETLFIASDVCLLPYEKSATSGLAFLSISYNTPMITSKLPAFEQFVSNGMALCGSSNEEIESAIYFTSKAFYSQQLDHIFHAVSHGDMSELEWDSIVKRPAFSQLFV